MEYPLIQIKTQYLPSLFIPDPAKIKYSYEQLLSKKPNSPFPYWAKIWPAGIALTNFLQSNKHWVENKKVLEIGAGIGLPSFSIANNVSNILISDHSLDAVELMHKNIAHLQENNKDLNNIHAAVLDWNNFPNLIKAETIILSDVNYAPEQFEPLIGLLKKFILEGSTIILSTPQRIMASSFVEALQLYIKESHLQSITDNQQNIEISIFILYA